MRNLAITLVLTIALIGFFSWLDYYPTETTKQIGAGTQYMGDSELIVSGDGNQVAELIIQTEPGEETEPKEEQTETGNTETTRNPVAEREDIAVYILAEDAQKYDVVISFLCGVSAALVIAIEAMNWRTKDGS